MPVVATAGHVDHGKSTLVHALTGIDPDRLAEEKARGLTIDLGFAWTTLPSGEEVSFVDVPGHVRFLGNMLAGVGAVQACLFVVDGREGWKPQSEEHLRILELLAVPAGVVALTKVATLSAAARAAARDQVAARLAGTFLSDAEVVEVDAPAGLGVDALRAALDRLSARMPAPVDRGRPRLWVDRSFSIRGAGTVVTGTLAGGPLAVGDELMVASSGVRARVRGLQTHRSAVERSEPGRRVAVNVAGIAPGDVGRGDALVRAGDWWTTRTVDCTFTVLSSVAHQVTGRGAYQAHIGSGAHAVRLQVLDGHRARLHLPVPLPLVPGDRCVLRDSGRSETIGGGAVVDVDPLRVVADRRWVDAHTLTLLTGEQQAPTVGRWVVAADTLAVASAQLRDAVVAAGVDGMDVAALDERGRAVLARMDDVTVVDGRARPTDVPWRPHPYLAALEAAPFAPPSPDGVDAGALRDLARRGMAVERDGVWFAASAMASAGRVVARLLAASPDGITAAAVRQALGTSRKYVLPLLGHLDATGVTRRRGDVRIAGPRLPRGVTSARQEKVIPMRKKRHL